MKLSSVVFLCWMEIHGTWVWFLERFTYSLGDYFLHSRCLGSLVTLVTITDMRLRFWLTKCNLRRVKLVVIERCESKEIIYDEVFFWFGDHFVCLVVGRLYLVLRGLFPYCWLLSMIFDRFDHGDMLGTKFESEGVYLTIGRRNWDRRLLNLGRGAKYLWVAPEF